jgi:hypothetical protein
VHVHDVRAGSEKSVATPTCRYLLRAQRRTVRTGTRAPEVLRGPGEGRPEG